MEMEAHSLQLRPASATETDPALSCPCPKLLPSNPIAHVTFRHPGYPDLSNILFRLPAYDGREPDDDGTGGWGVHHGTALWACSIIACNIDGFLHPTLLQSPPDGSLPVETSLDALLTAKVYYFYPRAWTSPLDLEYPVCPSFHDWQFPHDTTPKVWKDVYEYTRPVPRIPKASQFTTAVLLRDITCRVSDFDDCTDTAHIIPKKEYDWFTRNQMEVYNLNASLPKHLLTSDIENCICLRTDIHSLWDSAAFVFVPKSKSSRMHFLTVTRQYGPLLHNRETEEFRISYEFLYARFAWAVLPLAQTFAAKVGVKVCVWNAEQNGWVDKVNEPEVPRSPRKRPRLEQRESQPRGSVSGATQDTSIQDGFEDLDNASGQSPECHPSFAESRRYWSTTNKRSPQSPTKTPPSQDRGYEGRKRVFDGIVSRDPAIAWERLSWHPDVERLEKVKDQYLTENEPLHEQEVKRQLAILERGGFLFDDESQWDNDYGMDEMLVDDQSDQGSGFYVS